MQPYSLVVATRSLPGGQRRGLWNRATAGIRVLALSGLLGMMVSVSAAAGERIWVPVRWCGVAGAPSVENPAAIGEASSDTMLWRRHERPTDRFYHDTVDMTFRAAATAAIRNGPQSFPIIRDPQGSGGDLFNSSENYDAVLVCRHAWTMGDAIYVDADDNGAVDAGGDTLLSQAGPSTGDSLPGHDGGALNAMPADTGYVDDDSDGAFDLGERIYRDENGDGAVDGGDTLLTETAGTEVGEIAPADAGATLLSLPAQIKYLDLIREPPGTYNVGYPAVEGITAISANDIEFTGIAFPVHGVAIAIGSLAANMDDPAQYLPPGPDFLLFETQLVGHEFGHALSLRHGDGHDDNMDGLLDNGDDPTAPISGAGPGTLCDANNVMQYCWLDEGSSGDPDMRYIGPGTADYPSFTAEQAQAMREHAVTEIDDHVIDPVPRPLAATRVDLIGEVAEEVGFVDIADFALRINNARTSTVFELTTRRPMPDDLVGLTAYHFILDLDGNRNSGGAAAAVGEPPVPSRFEGAEYIASAVLRGRQVATFELYEFDTASGSFRRLDDRRIKARRERINAIPDFPFGNRPRDPDDFTAAVAEEFPVAERIEFTAPAELVSVGEDAVFRVEYVASRPDAGTVDRARSPGLNFRPPVYPQCRTEPASVHPGGTTMVFASGLLPERDQHLLLGDQELTHGMSDGAGNANFTVDIPVTARTGERLVTVGADAVSADCSVTVEGTDGSGEDAQDKPSPGLLEECCRYVSTQLWLVVALLVVIVLVLLLRRR